MIKFLLLSICLFITSCVSTSSALSCRKQDLDKIEEGLEKVIGEAVSLKTIRVFDNEFHHFELTFQVESKKDKYKTEYEVYYHPASKECKVYSYHRLIETFTIKK